MTENPLPADSRSASTPMTFVDRWPHLVTAFHAEGVQTWAFLVKGDLGAMQNYCKRYFLDPTANRVVPEPISPYVLVQFSKYQGMGGADGTYPDIGGQQELAVVFFARDKCRNDELVAISPYIVVDNPMSASQASEVFGLSKEFGELECTPDQGDPEVARVRVRGVANVAAPQATFGLLELLVIQRLANGDDFRRFVGLDDLLAQLRDLAAQGALALDLLPNLITQSSTILSLKQFKDVSSSTIACYQSVIASRLSMVGIHDVRHLGAHYQLCINALDTHPLARDLGLPAQMRSELSFYMAYDVDLTGEVWS
jgi:hypothetical protein